MADLIHATDAASRLRPTSPSITQLDLHLEVPPVLGRGFSSRAKQDVLLFFKFYDHQRQQLRVSIKSS